MTATDAAISLRVTVDLGGDVGADQLDEATRELLAELRDGGVTGASLPEDMAPAGSKSGAAVAVGTMVIGLLPKIVPKLVAILKSWLDRSPRKRTLRLVVQRGGETTELVVDSDGLSGTDVAKALPAFAALMGGRGA